MFKRAVTCFAFLILTAAFATYWYCIRIRQVDIANYTQMIQEREKLRNSAALDQEPSKQKRENVQKDIWTKNGHFQMKSDKSELILTQKKDKIEAVEYNQNFTLQNDFIFTADEASLSVPSNQLIAKNHCHLIKDNSNIYGDQFDFDLNKEIATYTNPHGHLKNNFEFQAKVLIWKKKENQLFLNHEVSIQTDQCTIRADSAVITLDEFKPKLLILKDNVQFISKKINDKESYALAGTLTYNPNDKTILLNAEKNVLFWQDGFTLSAPEVLIQQNKTIEGHGTIHLTFDLEEQSAIDQFIKQYL